ncbi:hypothetical protein RsY01_375 [Lactococcus reticulitermitis]|uniref:Uncharacterized protein n=1 Tax=Pseudolactococcus reticulitermitis TaxID=2025039 RepID=A0A224XAP5_9LACT|nr:hypothetical protein RsY01_375 [Lactococcus reticulitermitis]
MLRPIEYNTVTPDRCIAAISKLCEYTTVDPMQIKAWLESCDYVKTLLEVDEVFDQYMQKRGEEGYKHAGRVYRQVKM